MSQNQDLPRDGQEYRGAGRPADMSSGAEYGQNPYGAASAPGGDASPYGVGPQPQQQWQQPWAQQQWPPQQQWPQGPVQEPQRPRTLTAAFWLIVSAGLIMAGSLLLAALAMGTPEGRAVVEEAFRQQLQGGGLPEAEVQQMLQASLDLMPLTLLFFGLLGLAVYLLIAFLIRNGSRAARVAGAILAGLSALLLLVSLLGGAVGLDVVWVGLGVAGIVLSFRPEVTEYMRQKAWAKTLR